MSKSSSFSNSLVGIWSPPSVDDSNISFTISLTSDGLAISAVDVFDGERLDVAGLVVDGEQRSLRFSSYTPSTDATLGHELTVVSAGELRHVVIDRELDRTLSVRLCAAPAQAAAA